VIQRLSLTTMYRSDQYPLNILEQGEISITGEYLWGSNYTFAVEISLGDQTLQGVYKPTRGERPLWDFPRATLAHREVAAYLVSEALGWSFVPPTIFREEGPIGPGSLQLYVDHDPEYNYFSFSKVDLQRLRPVAAFDYLINNADRKGSHILFDPDGQLWLIDHGISFHQEQKLRTVVWDFAGEPLPDQICSDLANLELQLNPGTILYDHLEHYLVPQEIIALVKRNRLLISSKTFPDPHPNRRPYPWPPV
jgi:uncharacterized repeat protein (TIGR03843 family)